MKFIPDKEGICVIPRGTQKICENDIQNRREVRGVIIPDTVKLIDRGSFKGCVNLLGVYIPHSVSCIGDFAFDGCVKMRKVSFLKASGKSGDNTMSLFPQSNCCYNSEHFYTSSDDLCKIGKYAFRDCIMLELVEIQHRAEYIISSGAFLGCRSLARLIIPDTESLTFGEDVFSDCMKLKELAVEKNAGGFQYFQRTEERNKYNGLLPDVAKSLYQTGSNIKTASPVFEGCCHCDGGMEIIYFSDGILKRACVYLNKCHNYGASKEKTVVRDIEGFLKKSKSCNASSNLINSFQNSVCNNIEGKDATTFSYSGSVQEKSVGYISDHAEENDQTDYSDSYNAQTNIITKSPVHSLASSKLPYYDDDMYEEQFENGRYIIKEKVDFKRLKETHSVSARDESFLWSGCCTYDLSGPRF